MHRILVTIISAVASCALSVSAGNAGIMAHAGSDESGALDRLVFAMASSSVTFDYTYRFTPVSGPVLSGTGSVRFQGNSFIMKGNGLEIYCDGKSRWTIDRSAREAVAESFDAGHPDYLANPALILGNITDAFELEPGQSDSAAADEITLVPAADMGQISSVRLSFSPEISVSASGASFRAPSRVVLGMHDGSVMDMTISGFGIAPAEEDTSRYSFDETGLGDDYIVTDLR